MKLAAIAAGLFVLSYLLVNRGFGPDPLALVVPLVVVLATTLAAGRMVRRRKKPSAKLDDFDLPLDTPVRPQPMPPLPSSGQSPRPDPQAPPRPPGGKARKLF